MSDFELMYMHSEYIGHFQTAFADYLALLSMFLVAGYLVSAKLKANMVFIVVAVFTVAAFLQGSILFLSSQDALGALGQIAQRANIDPSGLGWHIAASFQQTPGAIILFEYVPITLEILSYLGALIFFFHQRHVGRAQ